MALHSFDPEIAQKVGVTGATIYQNISYWIEKNQSNDKHLYDGQYWTYNSTKAFAEQFPYLTVSQIKTALNKLVEHGFIVKGNYNKIGLDKTNWYGLAINRQSIGQKSPMGRSEIANGLAKNRQPIPDSKPDIKPNSSGKILKERDQYGQDDQPTFNQFLTELWAYRWKDGDDRKPAYLAYCKLTPQQRKSCAQVAAQAQRAMRQRDNTFRKSMAAWLNANGWESFKPQHTQQEAGGEWVKRMNYFDRSGDWAVAWGPKPGSPGCKVPPEFLTPPSQEDAA
ncbi:hypothetical protein [Maritalea porphyrae]|uniref:hypothetical protein n=1 Tax=Maritalea porphyrae TaxID=880732 RepID=UPI0022AF5010|nr:hypothetical protein [Maritalea porphyrae]MCZ4270915.1 hypothetical protein [Maritalea porphyrae]